MNINNVEVNAKPTLLSPEGWANFVNNAKQALKTDGAILNITVEQNERGYEITYKTTGADFKRIKRNDGERFVFEGIEFTVHNLGHISKAELHRYIEKCKAAISADEELVRIDLKLCDDGKVDVVYTAKAPPFERIRRITGYLTGDLNSWNNAKRAEEKERVHHDYKESSDV